MTKGKAKREYINKRQNLSEKKVSNTWFTGFHPNAGKCMWVCFICIESAAIAQKHLLGKLLRFIENRKAFLFWKTDHLRTRTEIHLLSIHVRYTHVLSSTRQ